jgi:hypothetical protein
MQWFIQQKRGAPTPHHARLAGDKEKEMYVFAIARRAMNRCTYRVSLALTVLAVLGLTVAAVAQEPPTNLVPFMFTYVSTGDSITIPVNPPVQPTRLLIASGQSDLLGSFTGIGHVINHLGADGTLVYTDGGVGVLTAANGDAVFFTHAGVARPPTTPGVVAVEARMTITGGKGRFVGATGSGILNTVIDFSKRQATVTFEGMITAPKP